MSTVYLSLGSNLGDRHIHIHAALAALEENNITVEKISSIRETDPVGGPAQGKFLNAVVKAKTALSPQELLKTILAIEHHLGRRRNIRNGPRTIDIDILLYDNLRIKTPDLVIPHPRMGERSFVMEPLKEIEPQILSDHPGAIS